MPTSIGNYGLLAGQSGARFRNVYLMGSEDAPAYACLEIIGRAYNGGLVVRKPASSDMGGHRVLFASDQGIRAGGWGEATNTWPVLAVYGSSVDAANRERIGTVAGEWGLRRGYEGFLTVDTIPGMLGDGKIASVMPDVICRDTVNGAYGYYGYNVDNTRPSHGNPGCCGDVYTCDGYLRIDLSYMVNGCPSDCNEAEGYAINLGSQPEPCPPYSTSANWDSVNYCDNVADSPGANGEGPECTGGWLSDGGSSGIVTAVSSNYDPMGGGWIDKTLDACTSGCGFTCYDDASGSSVPPCESRWFFCASYNYFQGMADGPPWPDLAGLGCVTRPGINPFYRRVDGGAPILYPDATPPPVQWQYPAIATQYHQDVLYFEQASCAPMIMEVKDLEPWLTNRQDGIRGIGVVTCYTDGDGNEAYIFEYETVPLEDCTPTFNATFTMTCVPCV